MRHRTSLTFADDAPGSRLNSLPGYRARNEFYANANYFLHFFEIFLLEKNCETTDTGSS
jgi:hypothetical protein